MRTTIDLPEDLFREAKTRAVQQGTTLKSLITRCIELGLRGPEVDIPEKSARRPPPPVAIRRTPGQTRFQPPTKKELNAFLEEDEVLASRLAAQQHNGQA